METTRREVWLDATRKRAGRVGGRALAARHGYFYLWRRRVIGNLARSVARGGTPVFVDVPIAELGRVLAGAVVHEVHAPWREVVPPVPVHTSREWLARRQPEWCELDVPAMVVLDLPGGVLWGSDGMPGALPDGLVTEFPTVFGLEARVLARRCDAGRRAGQATLPGTTVSLLQHSPGNFSHWLLQGLPRIDLLRGVVELHQVDRVLVNDGAPTMVFDTLVRMGVAPDRVVRVPQPGRVFRCERLVVPTPVPLLAAVPAWAQAFLADRFLDGRTAPEPHRRVFVVRDGVRRQMVNRADVIAALVARGFTTVRMETLTVPEQAALFAGADCIVAEHGAALANLVFARRGTRVVELMPANFAPLNRPSHHVLSARRGLRHDVLLGIEPTLPRRLWVQLQDADQIVDVARLVELVEDR